MGQGKGLKCISMGIFYLCPLPTSLKICEDCGIPLAQENIFFFPFYSFEFLGIVIYSDAMEFKLHLAKLCKMISSATSGPPHLHLLWQGSPGAHNHLSVRDFVQAV